MCIRDRGRKALVHLAVDTGMSRIGLFPDETGVDAAVRIAALPGIEVEGLFTHFSRADEGDPEYTDVQFSRYGWFADRLKESGIRIPICPVSYTHLDVYKRQVKHLMLLIIIADMDLGADFDFSLIGGEETVDDFQDRSFAGSVIADNSDALPAADIEIHVGKQLIVVKALG